MMRRAAILLTMLLAAGPAFGQTLPAPPVAPAPLTVWEPAKPYISIGQDEPGYRNWYVAAPWHAAHVRVFNDYLVSNGVGAVVPTWQLLRTATSWQRCGAQPFEVPPTSEWPHLVQTLRYIRDHVVPDIGPVEPVSTYRNPVLNVCAGGAPDSAHKQYSAIDMVPLRPIARPDLIRRLCTRHAQSGPDYRAGLGFYAFVRFHVDSTRFRRWGHDSMPDSPVCPSIVSQRPANAVALRDMPPEAPPAPQDSAATTH